MVEVRELIRFEIKSGKKTVSFPSRPAVEEGEAAVTERSSGGDGIVGLCTGLGPGKRRSQCADDLIKAFVGDVS